MAERCFLLAQRVTLPAQTLVKYVRRVPSPSTALAAMGVAAAAMGVAAAAMGVAAAAMEAVSPALQTKFKWTAHHTVLVRIPVAHALCRDCGTQTQLHCAV